MGTKAHLNIIPPRHNPTPLSHSGYSAEANRQGGGRLQKIGKFSTPGRLFPTTPPVSSFFENFGKKCQISTKIRNNFPTAGNLKGNSVNFVLEHVKII